MAAEEGTVAALLRERDGYAAMGRANRVAQVDAELAKFGVHVEPAREERADDVVAEERPAKRHKRDD